MLVIITKNISKRDSGKLSLLMYQVTKDVFIGNINAKIRKNIQENIIIKNSISACFVYDYPNEQGFIVESFNDFDIFTQLDFINLVKK